MAASCLARSLLLGEEPFVSRLITLPATAEGRRGHEKGDFLPGHGNQRTLLHLIWRWDVVVGGWYLATCASMLSDLVAGFLSFQGFRLFRQGGWLC
jgi:hypothetical protein